MIGNRNAVANVAVRDVARAKDFYTRTLGLEPVDEMEGEVVVLKSGDSRVNVYRSDHAGTNEATAVSWEVDDIAAEVESLRGKGVTFEHYDMPGIEVQGDLHVGDGMKVAWFKDPDGNILHLIEE